MGKKGIGIGLKDNNIVKVGCIILVFVCSALVLWGYDNERSLLELLLIKKRGQTAGSSNDFSITNGKFDQGQSAGGTLNIQNSNSTEKEQQSVLQEGRNGTTLTAPDGLITETDRHQPSLIHDLEDMNKGNTSMESARPQEITNRSGDEDESRIAAGRANVTAPDPQVECDLFTGSWVYDESYVLYLPGECSFSSTDFNCIRNGRKDGKYPRWRWQPRDCDLPRFNASEFLEKLRGKRLVYVGDSINRNQWESMLCMLRRAVPEGGGSFRATNGGKTVAYVIHAYNCSVELSWAPFLVRQHKIPAPINATGNAAAKESETLQIDTMDELAEDWKRADILVFNTGHWWTHPEPNKGINYFEEGGLVHPHMEEPVAFEKALRTWATWVDANIDPLHTQVFFRSYSPVHFNGRMWGKKEGGGCFNESEPIAELEEAEGRRTSDMERVWAAGRVMEGVKKVSVKFVNITWISLHRKDAHVSVYNNRDDNSKRIAANKNDYSKADCSHWCLPGLPDVWNHLLSALIH